MEHNAKGKSTELIDKAVEIRVTFGCASLVNEIQALKTFYESMLWNLSGGVYTAWDTTVELS
jgi:hypothetical protein